MNLLKRQEGPLFIRLILSFYKTVKQEFKSNSFLRSALIYSFLVKAKANPAKFQQTIAKFIP